MRAEEVNHMSNDVLDKKYNEIEYYMSRGNNIYFRNSDCRLRVDCTGTGMQNDIVYGNKYNLELSIFASSNEF